MKFYDSSIAPSSRRTRIFIAEKGLDVEVVEVDLFKGEHMTDEFKAMNPGCTVPTLLLDDGTALTENTSIAFHLEQVKPDPPLLGTSPLETAQVLNWHARAEHLGWHAVMESFRNHSPYMKDRSVTGTVNYPQIPELVERGRERTRAFYEMLDAHLSGRDFIVGDRYSLADIIAMCTVDWSTPGIEVPIPEGCSNLKRWYDAAAARPASKV